MARPIPMSCNASRREAPGGGRSAFSGPTISCNTSMIPGLSIKTSPLAKFAGSNHCLRHLDRITDENLFAMKRNRATEIAYRRVLIDFHGSRVVGRTRDVGYGSAGFDQRDFDTELRDFR